ncbi:hypothetical protein BJV74DRAFT_813847 [Russula compacta]|nr:hypothetical protein BJV74DRAFT_813847 [Russula compacta]
MNNTRTRTADRGSVYRRSQLVSSFPSLSVHGISLIILVSVHPFAQTFASRTAKQRATDDDAQVDPLTKTPAHRTQYRSDPGQSSAPCDGVAL